mgnify:CR=1 FL=1
MPQTQATCWHAERFAAASRTERWVSRRRRPLVLRCHRSPGDIVVMTAAVRDLHLAHGERLRILVDTSCRALWDHNPRVRVLAGPCDYPSNAPVIQMDRPPPRDADCMHYTQTMTAHLEKATGLPIRLPSRRGDLHLSTRERASPRLLTLQGQRPGAPYWVIIAGGKHACTTKWWNPDHAQQVVDHFRGRITFVQCGTAADWHPRLEGAVDLVGHTDLRQLLRVLYHAAGVVCPVTFAMHAAAALPTPGSEPRRCVVIAGGREPPAWERYPGHDYLDTVGRLICCRDGGCWTSVCQPGPGDPLAGSAKCIRPVVVAPGLVIPECMQMIRGADVIGAIERRAILPILPHG